MSDLLRFQLPWSAWNDETHLELAFARSLNPRLLSPNDSSPWDQSQIREAVASPICSPPIRELAHGSRSVCIAVDDLARPTRAGDILPHVFAELRIAGVTPDRCVVVIATGTHGSLTSEDIRKKVGDETMRNGARIEVHNQEHLLETGILYGKQELRINKSFLQSEFKLGISSVLPHSFAGFSGGAKMMLPGLADVDATARSHKFVQMGLRAGDDLQQNRFRQEIERIALQLGFEFTICAICNQSRHTSGVYAGHVVDAHRAACTAASNSYQTPCNGVYDAMVLNAYPKDTDLIQAENSLIAFKQTGFNVVRESGVIVICTAARELGEHGLFAPGGLSYREPAINRALGKRELWILAPNMDEKEVRKRYWKGYPHFSEIADLNRALCQRLGSDGRIGILPIAPMQQLARNDKGGLNDNL